MTTNDTSVNLQLRCEVRGKGWKCGGQCRNLRSWARRGQPTKHTTSGTIHNFESTAKKSPNHEKCYQDKWRHKVAFCCLNEKTIGLISNKPCGIPTWLFSVLTIRWLLLQNTTALPIQVFYVWNITKVNKYIVLLVSWIVIRPIVGIENILQY